MALVSRYSAWIKGQVCHLSAFHGQLALSNCEKKLLATDPVSLGRGSAEWPSKLLRLWHCRFFFVSMLPVFPYMAACHWRLFISHWSIANTTWISPMANEKMRSASKLTACCFSNQTASWPRPLPYIAGTLLGNSSRDAIKLQTLWQVTAGVITPNPDWIAGHQTAASESATPLSGSGWSPAPLELGRGQGYSLHLNYRPLGPLSWDQLYITLAGGPFKVIWQHGHDFSY